MPTADERLEVIRKKIERAKKHLDDLAAVRDRFIETNPYVIERQTDPNTGYYIFNVNSLQVPPSEVGLIVGDVIHNLRSALDHLACQLVLANGQPILRQTCFPIFDSAAKYKTMDVRKVNGMSQPAIDAIGATNPYQGGNNELWILHELDIADKHKELLTALVSVTGMVLSVPNLMRPGFKSPSFSLPNFLKPLKNGDVFFTCEPGVENDAEIAFDIAFCEPEIIEGSALLPSLLHLVERVDNTIISFKPLLA